MKRYIRLDIEYDSKHFIDGSFTITNNIKRILSEDMPFLKVVFTRDCPKEEDLNEPRMLRR